MDPIRESGRALSIVFSVTGASSRERPIPYTLQPRLIPRFRVIGRAAAIFSTKKAAHEGRLSTQMMNLRGGFRRLWHLEWLVVTSAIDRRHLRSHRTQIRRQFSPMMNAVIVQESEIEHRRKIEHVKESNRRQELLRRHPLHALEAALHVLVIPRRNFRRCLRLVLGHFHLEFQICDSVQELNVRVRDVPCQFFCRPCIWVRPVIRLRVGHRCQNFLCDFRLPCEAIEHQRAISKYKFRSHALRHKLSPSYSEYVLLFPGREAKRGASRETAPLASN